MLASFPAYFTKSLGNTQSIPCVFCFICRKICLRNPHTPIVRYCLNGVGVSRSGRPVGTGRVGKLVWAAVGFTIAAFGAEYALPASGLPLIAAAPVLLAPLCLLLKGPRRRAALTVALSMAAGFLAWWAHYTVHIAPCEAMVGERVTVTARVADYPRASDGYTRLTVRVMDGAPRERAYLYLYHGELPELRPGDIITAEVKTSSVMTQGGDRIHTITSAGVNLRGTFTGDAAVTGRWALSFLYLPQEIAERVKTLCAELFPDRTGVFMTALLTGDKQGLYDDAEMYAAMRQAGMLHAMAVSGMHVFVLIAFFQFIFGRGRRTGLVFLPVLVLFSLMAGSGASVTRAAIMQTIYLAAPFFERESDGPSAIAASLLMQLLVNPTAIGGVGLQMSYACIVGFAVVMPPLERRIKALRGIWRLRPLRYALASLACTASAMAFALPVSAYYFGAVPLLAPLTNLLALWVVELCFACGYIVCAVGALWHAAGAALGQLVSYGARWCLLVCRAAARLPFACLYTTDAGAVVWLAFTYALLIAYIVLRRRGKRPPAVVFLELSALGLCAVFLVTALRLRLGRREVAVLDVGQGACVALLDASAAVVTDCGGSSLTSAGEVAADYLLAAGKTRVDVLVLTHLHEDHANGVAALLYRMPVTQLVLPADCDDGDDMLGEILAAAEKTGTVVTFLDRDAEAAVGDMTLTLLLPQAGTDENERGIVALAAFDGASVLIMGDAGTNAELALAERAVVPDADVLIVGHHGSKTASGAMFLRGVDPRTAVISVGYNSYGLPAEEVTERLELYCDDVYRTDEDGTVVITLSR